ncbi:MAG: exodeoxyribonuclease VII small subunit [Treponema sp.]|uniref:exodeoxyribonuclease VII small subunit n=1 Tax=Treponema sp. TaxID=166 RepID=UPI001B56E765|nr:exodeoxyribonuclease VII small subunit [Treponema sp.]MBP5403115.1 exodeoxyribonuclease VII small subunit [Treponema sp.]MBR5934334.1 exodeoxyribonuclease VII small subunit [Treponema sp.]
MKNFEKNLQRLEEIAQQIKSKDISLEDALSSFEEGITLAKGMEKEIDRIEGKIQILMNQPAPDSTQVPELDLFSDADLETGSSGEPVKGTRQ